MRPTPCAIRSLILLALTAAALPARALSPDEIAVVFSKNSFDSQSLATFYMHARGIPNRNAIPLNIQGTDEGIAEANYRTTIVGGIRDALRGRQLDTKIKCLVTMYGIPLHVAGQKPSKLEEIEERGLRQEVVDTARFITDGMRRYDHILPDPATTPPDTATAPATAAVAPSNKRLPELPPPGELLKKLTATWESAATRINAAQGIDRRNGLKEFATIQQDMLGLAGVVQTININPNAPDAEEAQAHLSAMQSQLDVDAKRLRELAPHNDQPETRTQIRALRKEMLGAMGYLAQIENDILMLRRDQSESCVDNELMLLWEDNYPRTGWQNNPCTLEAHAGSPGKHDLPRIMMVSRLDAVSPALVRQIIEQSLKTESTGLDGIAYFDARGLHGTDAYAQYDQDLRDAAGWLKDNSTMPVVLDDKPALLEAKDCPNAALYCGWYSYFTYHDSCQWLPGSVAYHVASGELTTLHDPKTTVWVPNLLKRGVCASLGPTSEPYLSSFPKPSQFFPLLLTGQWSLAEVYYMTTPLTSWRIGLVGDPLYRPFKQKPRVTLEQIRSHPILRQALEIVPPEPAATAPASPANSPAR